MRPGQAELPRTDPKHRLPITLRRAMNALHHHAVFRRRVRVLSDVLAGLLGQLEASGVLLDIGCGDGAIAKRVGDLVPELDCHGVDIQVRPKTAISVTRFDGQKLPYRDNAVEWAMLVDVLHHTADPAVLLAEAKRVARCGIVIKDHLCDGLAADTTLRIMDWVGNRGHDVVLPYTYLSRSEWGEVLSRTGLTVETETKEFRLYPVPFSWLFDRGLHFVMVLR